MKVYYNANSKQNKQAFLSSFPYQKYLKEVKFTNFDKLQADRHFLWRTKIGDGDEFLYHLGEKFTEVYPVRFELNDLRGKIEIGEAFLHANPNSRPGGGKLSENGKAIYRIIGYHILAKVARVIEEGNSAQRVTSQMQPQLSILIKRLGKSKIYVRSQQSSFSKLKTQLKAGNFGYIGNRARLMLSDVMQKTGEKYHGLLADGFFRRYLVVESGKSSALPRIQQNKTLSLSSQAKFYRHGGSYDVSVYSLKDKSRSATNSEIGHAIWMHRPNVKARYLASGNVFSNYKNIARRNNIVLVVAGGFTNNHRPEGLTVEKGKIVNPVLMHDRDALVVIHDTGGISVINLERSKVKLPLSPRKALTINNPLTDLVAYSKLLRWCREKRATVFQTQLLAFSNKLLLDPAKARKKQRERRILALARNNRNQELYHVVFNISSNIYLGEISLKIFSFFNTFANFRRYVS